MAISDLLCTCANSIKFRAKKKLEVRVTLIKKRKNILPMKSEPDCDQKQLSSFTLFFRMCRECVSTETAAT